MAILTSSRMTSLYRALAAVTILIFKQCNTLFMKSVTCTFQKTQRIRKIYGGPQKISERVNISLLSEFTLVSEITPVDGTDDQIMFVLRQK